MYILKNRFIWDPIKAELNKRKHGISFENAMTVFDDPMALITDDHKHSVAEQRKWLIGKTDFDKLIVVVFTERNTGELIRIISARPANRRERRLYATLQRIPF